VAAAGCLLDTIHKPRFADASLFLFENKRFFRRHR
jgi:hypothetical protein